MALTRKDLAATGLTTQVVLTYLATHRGWAVPLVGDSHRWAAGVILLLGILTCGQGSPSRSAVSMLCGALGALALILAIVALVTASLTPLSLLVVDIVVLWAVSTFAHARHIAETPLTS
jgi:hypothetical protein